MALLATWPLSTTFAGLGLLEANGTSVTGDESPGGIGTHLYMLDGKMVARNNETDAATSGGHRSEIVPGPVESLGNERWYSFEWMAPSVSWPAVDGCSGNRMFAIMQIHDTPGSPRCPCFELWYDGKEFMVNIPAFQPPIENENYRGMGAIGAELDVWHTVVLHALWSNTAAGLLEIYINRMPIFRAFGIGTAYNADAPFLKLGTYNYQGLTGFGERVGYYRNLKIYSTGDLFTDILGGQLVCRPFAVD